MISSWSSFNGKLHNIHIRYSYLHFLPSGLHCAFGGCNQHVFISITFIFIFLWWCKDIAEFDLPFVENQYNQADMSFM